MEQSASQENSEVLFDKSIRDSVFVIIESNNALRRNIVRSLKTAGAIHLIEAEKGKEGVMALNSNKEVHVIICSAHLKDLIWNKLLDFLKKSKKFHATAFLLVSSSSDLSTVQKAIAAGADGFITKPFAMTKLKEFVEAGIQTHKKRIAMNDKVVELKLAVKVSLEGQNLEGVCLKLHHKGCDLDMGRNLGVGSRINLQLAAEGNTLKPWFERLAASVSSEAKNAEGKVISKVVFRAKPTKIHGVVQLLS